MEKKYFFYLGLSVLFFVFGIVLFLVRRNWLIVHWVPSYQRSDDISGVLGQRITPKKKAYFYYWRDEGLKKEETSLVLLGSKADILKLLIGSWLTFVYEERLLQKKVGIDSVALSSSEQEVYISFSQCPFVKEWSINQKWQLLDGLCHTIASVNLGIQKLGFLVQHEPIVDDHLDFSQPWPVGGFDN